MFHLIFGSSERGRSAVKQQENYDFISMSIVYTNVISDINSKILQEQLVLLNAAYEKNKSEDKKSIIDLRIFKACRLRKNVLSPPAIPNNNVSRMWFSVSVVLIRRSLHNAGPRRGHRSIDTIIVIPIVTY